MANIIFTLLLSIHFLLGPSISARSIHIIKPDKTDNQIASRRLLLSHATTDSAVHFMSHPLWVGVTVSFAAGFFLGAIFYVIYRLSAKYCNLRVFIKKRLHPEPVHAATVFTPLLLSPDNLSFVDDLCHGRLPTPLQVIGRGGCGEVYRADLISADRTVPVAIKKVVYPSLGATQLCAEESKFLDHRMRQIRSEIKTVSRMRHPNLVRLLAHVPQPGSHCLVYEYMPHGSLHDVLKHGNPELDWPRRYKIALGIAAGLEYLHMAHRPKVIHRDLKPGNILLDIDLNARIGDFGLAKLVQLDTVSGAINSSNVAGTLGYIAPEYY